ncbi:MAG: BtpA/SgcQ family protein [Proteobacteria bacterium]|nr:BtpA/SgcQ family protein [Pseudomonadota bacterium]MCP4919577.1 BtpA/SgcQ family protein [Pseudomonadota bacterium]
MQSFKPLLDRRALTGVLHLPPLPGSPRPGPGFDAILSGALRDAEVLAEGGARGVIVENMGDAPFSKDHVEPHVTAMLAIVAREVRVRFGDQLVVGVNALRNDGLSSLGAVAAAGGAFVRVNVLVGVMVTDQGLIEGKAREVLTYRRQAATEAAIVADVLVKHASPLGPVDLAQIARDTFRRAGASVLVASGSGTGQPTDLAEVRAMRDAVPEATIWVGSGVTGDTARKVGRVADGAIVGTWLHKDGDVRAPLELGRVRRVAEELGQG